MFIEKQGITFWHDTLEEEDYQNLYIGLAKVIAVFTLIVVVSSVLVQVIGIAAV